MEASLNEWDERMEWNEEQEKPWLYYVTEAAVRYVIDVIPLLPILLSCCFIHLCIYFVGLPMHTYYILLMIYIL